MPLNISDLVKKYEPKMDSEKDKPTEERAREYLTQHHETIIKEVTDFEAAIEGPAYKNPKSVAGIENRGRMITNIEQNKLALEFLSGTNTRNTRLATADVLDRYAERALTHAQGWDELEKRSKTTLSSEDKAALQRADMILTAQELRNILI